MEHKKLIIAAANSGNDVPANAVLYEDGTPVRYENNNYVLYE